MELMVLLFLSVVMMVVVSQIRKKVTDEPIKRPCPPAPHRWEYVTELDQYGQTLNRIKCLNCQRYAGEID